MATISSTISLRDNFTGTIDRILNSINQTTAAMDSLENTMSSPVSVSGIEGIHNEVEQTTTAIRNVENQQNQWNDEMQEGADQASKLKNMISSALAAYTGISGIRKTISWIQDCTEAFNTQLNAENQLVTVLRNTLDSDYVAQFGDGGDAAAQALQAEYDAITAKASEIQSKGIYGDEAMTAAAAEFATYFSDTDAITTMMETLADYAMGMTGGGEIDSTAMVDYATNLGKIMTGSYDAMTKKGFEFSDAQKAIIEDTVTQQQIVETLGEEYVDMTSDMQAAAAISQVIEESWSGLYESMSDTPEGKIIQMNNAFGDLQETIGGQLYPYVILFVDAINDNWSTIESVVNGFTTALQFVMGILASLMDALFSVAQVVQDNWTYIAPVVYGVAAALLIYNGYLAATKVYAAAAAAAQWALNAAQAASPTTWVIAGIIALIAVIYLAVAAYNHLTDSTVSATGIICGVIATAAALIWNTIIGLINSIIQLVWTLAYGIISISEWVTNVCIGGFDSFGDACANLIGNIISWFLELGKVVTVIIDAIFGTDWTSGLESLQSSLTSWGKNETAITLDRSAPTIGSSIDYSDVWNAGYSFGEGVEDTISNFSMSDLFGTSDITSATDYLDVYASDISDIADSASTVADSVDCTEEQLKYLRDIAEQETVNRFTLADVTVNQTNNNNVSSSMDLDGVIDGLTDAAKEALEVVAEGVHY
ncbi:MAG: hypothetical protein LUG61_11165 [Lachnospiraceae bacterium]|nr:hypothetical protein [Lachnospiraceae bacterium]